MSALFLVAKFAAESLGLLVSAVGTRKSNRNRVWNGCSAIAMAIALSRTAHAQQVYVQDFVKSTFTPETVWQPALTAGFSNWVSQPTGFGTGLNGYGYHYGVAIADNVSGKFMRKFAFAAISTTTKTGFLPFKRAANGNELDWNWSTPFSSRPVPVRRTSTGPDCPPLSLRLPCLTLISRPNSDQSPQLSAVSALTAAATRPETFGLSCSKLLRSIPPYIGP